jgi:alkanesulfonate monooxygenase SsuD/methylene tetrahydromethanopterin reductase-like flavin-dependent oxidoreductase (luciferase family)
MACGTPAGLRRAARVADGIVLDSVRSPDNVAALANQFRSECDRLGRPPGRVAVMRRGWIGTQAESDAFVGQLHSELSAFATKAAGAAMPWLDQPSGLTVESVRARTLAGDAEGVVEQLEALEREAGVDEVIVKVQWTSGTDLGVLVAQLARWADVCASRPRA